MKFWKVFRIVTTILFLLALVFVFLLARHRLATMQDDSDLPTAPVIVR
jgi:hypothetical protein